MELQKLIAPGLSPVLALALCPALLFGAELPVRTVVLYKHGVGYFERAGNLAAGQSAQLDFKADEMNDVLKSLTVVDNGGAVTGIRYDSNIPLDRKLAEFPFHLEAGEPLSAVLDPLRGARLELEFGLQKIAGAIVSAREIPGDRDHAAREQLTLLLDSGEMRNLDLSAASSIHFTDPTLQQQFRDYLAALTSARSKEKRSVYIDSSDTKSRDVKASYIMPMPAWKSSYRLLFADAAQQPTLEGWAIVDNTTGDDWTNVHISLVSGKPVSFISQLYDPKYIARRSAELAEDQPADVIVHSGAINAEMAPAPAAPKAAAALGAIRSGVVGGVPGSGGGGFGPGEGGGIGGGVYRSAQSSSVAVTANATEIADLFEYAIRNPVTVRKNESAMLPFLQQKVGARKLIIYSDSSKLNPMSAAELTNNTGRTLDGGPITVYDSGAYAGEALVETIKNGDKRFISYGVDLGTRITTNLNSSRTDTRELHVHDGMLITRYSQVDKKTYTIRNVDARAKTLIIEHPVRTNYKLTSTAKPVETAANVYRFEVALPANGNTDFPVTEEYVYDQQFTISSLTPDALLVAFRNRDVSDAARRQLQQIVDLKTRLAAITTEKSRNESDLNNIARDEERARQNIQSLSQVPGQQQIVQDYARGIADFESQISKLRATQAQLDTERERLQSQLNTLISQLNF
jgi:hypothetical protein